MKLLKTLSISLFLSTLFIFTTQGTLAKETGTDSVEILHFAGTIEFFYTDGTHFIISTGDEIPVLSVGTIIRILEGKLTLQIGDDINSFVKGQIVRITLDSEEGWQEFDSVSKAAQGVGLSNFSGAAGINTETGRSLSAEILDSEEATSAVSIATVASSSTSSKKSSSSGSDDDTTAVSASSP